MKIKEGALIVNEMELEDRQPQLERREGSVRKNLSRAVVSELSLKGEKK